jgi:hypothetical protein
MSFSRPVDNESKDSYSSELDNESSCSCPLREQPANGYRQGEGWVRAVVAAMSRASVVGPVSVSLGERQVSPRGCRETASTNGLVTTSLARPAATALMLVGAEDGHHRSSGGARLSWR